MITYFYYYIPYKNHADKTHIMGLYSNICYLFKSH